jgi:hypothetical protein
VRCMPTLVVSRLACALTDAMLLTTENDAI